jgi:26S proteasome regulatory subunit N1
MKRQLAFLIARAQIPLEWLHPIEDSDTEEMIEEFPEDLIECLSNAHLSMHFRDFGKELGVLEPKSLEDVYKSHLENTSVYCFCKFITLAKGFAGPGVNANIDSARANLAGTFVNAFVNAGFGNDKLLVEADEGNSWIYKNKDHGM